MVAMTSHVDSHLDLMTQRSIEQCDVMSPRLSGHDAPSGIDKNSPGYDTRHSSSDVVHSTTLHLPGISEDVRNSSDDPNMSNHGKPKSGRPGRRYTLSKNQSIGETDASSRALSRSKPAFLPRSASLDSSNGYGHQFEIPSSKSSLSIQSPLMSRSPRSPRQPRRLPSLSRTESQESPTTSPREKDATDWTNDTLEEQVEPEMIDNPVNDIAWSQQKQLPSSSSVFQQVLTDLHNRPNSSLGNTSPGDLMVRRSSLAATGILAVPLIEVDEETNDDCNSGMDIELESPKEHNHDTCAEPMEEDNNGIPKTQKSGSTISDLSKNNGRRRKKSSKPQSEMEKANGHMDNHKQTSPRRHIRFPVDNKSLPTCPVPDTNLAPSPSPSVLVNPPRAEVLEETASHVHRAQKSMKKWRSRNATQSVSGTSDTSVTSTSPERSPRPRRKISDLSVHHRDASPARSHHDYPTKIDMKTAGQITK